MNSKRLRRVTIVLLMSLIPIGAFGFGYFYSNKDVDNQVANTLTVDGNIDGSVVREVSDIGIVPGDTIDKSINILSNATAPSLIRVKIEPTWYDGDVKSNLSSNNIDILYTNNVKNTLNNDESKDYWYQSDNYLYYMDTVTKDEVINIVKGIKFNGESSIDVNLYQGKNLKIRVDLEIIQAKHKAYSNKWKITDEQLKGKLDALCDSIK